MASIREKIQKLLALSQSPNENEARAALLKAKELMAQHKLSEEDFAEVEKAELVHIPCPEIRWTTDSGNSWMNALAVLICNNYCCACGWITERGSRTHILQITGMKEDAEVCKSVIEYAVGFVLGKIKIYKYKYRSDPRSYAEGFILGLELAFDEQKEEHPEWGLVVVKPQEVNEYEKSLRSRSVRTRKTEFNPLLYLMGQEDGKNFNKVKALEVTNG